jgi:two-component system, chemotaxis family, sensor kinase CheA
MTKNVNELVLDAFRIEHREQLDQIRALLGSLHPGEKVSGDARTRDAFRLAHSFKGGARVCDLREAEQLGHGLEAVLEKITNGDMQFTKDVVSTITLVLDSIEDWMSALDGDQHFPDTKEALGAIEHLLAETSPSISAIASQANSTTHLLPVFSKEYAQHFECLRTAIDRWKGIDYRPNYEELTEIARVAHTLAGAAAVVEIKPVESAAQRLEQLVRAILANDQSFDVEMSSQLDEQLDAMANAMQGSNVDPAVPTCLGQVSSQTPSSEQATASDDVVVPPEADQNTRELSPSTTTIAHDTVRVTVDSLNRLVRSSSDMFADNQRVGHLGRHISDLELHVADLEREREDIRRVAFSSLHKLAATPEYSRVSRYLEYVDRQVSTLARHSRRLSVEHQRVAWQLRRRAAQIQRDVHQARLVPVGSVFQGFRKMVRDLAKAENKEIEFEAIGLECRADRMVLQELKDPLMHILRNCISHGIESPQQRVDAGKPREGRVILRLEVAGDRLNIVVEDDGRGVDIQQIQQRAVRRGLLTDAAVAHQSSKEVLSVVFEPGFSTVDSVTELAGRGMGLSIVQDSVARLQGQVTLAPRDQGGVKVSLSVPIFVSTHRVLLVACGDQTIAIPTQGVERLFRIPKDKVESLEGQPVVTYKRQPIRLIQLSEVLGLRETPNAVDKQQQLCVVLIKSGARLLAASVTALLEQRDALILNLDEFADTNLLAGGVLLDDGRVALVIQPSQLLENAACSQGCTARIDAAVAEPAGPARILIVDDSFTTRTLEKSILVAHGYDVSVAVDGVEAMSQLRQHTFSLVISDIEMPRMDGFALLEQMKVDRRCSAIPVILVTSRDRQEDQQRGLDLGADAYIVKRKFDHQELLSTIRQLL